MAQEATLKEIAKSKLRRLLTHGKSFECADVHTGASAPPYGFPPYGIGPEECAPRSLGSAQDCQGRESAPEWRGPAAIPEIDVTEEAVKFQSQTFEVAL